MSCAPHTLLPRGSLVDYRHHDNHLILHHLSSHPSLLSIPIAPNIDAMLYDQIICAPLTLTCDDSRMGASNYLAMRWTKLSSVRSNHAEYLPHVGLHAPL